MWYLKIHPKNNKQYTLDGRSERKYTTKQTQIKIDINRWL